MPLSNHLGPHFLKATWKERRLVTCRGLPTSNTEFSIGHGIFSVVDDIASAFRASRNKSQPRDTINTNHLLPHVSTRQESASPLLALAREITSDGEEFCAAARLEGGTPSTFLYRGSRYSRCYRWRSTGKGQYPAWIISRDSQ
jgi:hypothetical protein